MSPIAVTTEKGSELERQSLSATVPRAVAVIGNSASKVAKEKAGEMSSKGVTAEKGSGLERHSVSATVPSAVAVSGKSANKVAKKAGEMSSKEVTTEKRSGLERQSLSATVPSVAVSGKSANKVAIKAGEMTSKGVITEKGSGPERQALSATVPGAVAVSGNSAKKAGEMSSKKVTTEKGSGLELQSVSATVPGTVAVSGNSANKVANKAGNTLNGTEIKAEEEGVKRPPVGVSKQEPLRPQMSSKGVAVLSSRSQMNSKGVSTKKGSGLERQALSATVPGAVAVRGNTANKVAKKAGGTLNGTTTEAGEEDVKRPSAGVSKQESSRPLNQEPSRPHMSSKGVAELSSQSQMRSKDVTAKKGSGLERQALPATVPGAVAVSTNSASKIARKVGNTLNVTSTESGEEGLKRPPKVVSKQEPSKGVAELSSRSQMISKEVTTKKGSRLERQPSAATVPGAVAVSGNSANKVARKEGGTLNDTAIEAGEEGVKRHPRVSAKENLRGLLIENLHVLT
jgi:uncharacterized OsmC-like protein